MTPESELRRWRGERTQRQVADLVGVTPQAVSAWEAGTRPRLDLIRELDARLGADGALAAAYGVTMDVDTSPASEALEELRRRQDAVEQELAALRQQVAGRSQREGRESRQEP